MKNLEKTVPNPKFNENGSRLLDTTKFKQGYLVANAEKIPKMYYGEKYIITFFSFI